MKSLFAFLAGAAIGAGGVWLVLTEINDQPQAAAISTNATTPVTNAQPSVATTPAYMLVVGDVFDRAAFMEEYANKVAPFYEEHGGRYLAVGRAHERLENGVDFGSYVLAEWPSAEAAMAFWNDPDYVLLRENRLAKGFSELDVYLLPGLPRAAEE